MMSTRKPNLQLVYVTDIKRSTDFYRSIFNAEPSFISPRYVTFSAGDDAYFAIWSGGTTPDVSAPRFCEIGIMLSSDNDVDNLYDQWKDNPMITITKEIYTDVFGRTFLVSDPDGHVIRVCSVD